MIDHHVLQLASRQLGLVTSRQLVDLGYSRSAISRAHASRRLERILPGVSLVAPAPCTHEVRARAVNLWMGDGGFVSGRSAGRFHGLSRMGTDRIHYTVPLDTVRDAPAWIDLHRTTWYDTEADRVVLPNGVIVAGPERMLFGIAASIGPAAHEAVEHRRQRRFDDVADDAWNLELTTPQSMADYLERHRCRGKSGVARIEAWLERALRRDSPAQSYFERDLINALLDAGLPEPVRQHRLALRGHHPVKIDIAWPDIRLGIEPGHSRFHGGGSAIERDSLRDLACAEVGWDIHRLTEQARADLRGNARRIARIHRMRSADINRTES